VRIGVDAINLRADRRGMGRFVRDMIDGLATQHEITLLLRSDADRIALQEVFPDSFTYAPLRHANQTNAFDVVWYPWNGIRFATKAPSIVTFYDDFAFRFPARGIVARWREQAPIRRALARADAFTTDSRWTRDVFVQRFSLDAERCTVLPLAPAPIFTPNRERATYECGAERPAILVVGGAEPRKRIGAFARTFARAFPNGDVDLIVVGSPADHDRAALELAHATVRHADDIELLELYRRAAIVVVPSLAEGFGLVAVEAQASGAAVVASNATALPEAVGDAGLLIDIDDETGWIAALQRLIANPQERRAWGEAGARRWRETSRNDAVTVLARCFERLVDNRA
jgi:glycosyltransferase involved in cell wall biosynthesis